MSDEIEQLKFDNERLRKAVDYLTSELAAAQASGKAARRLAKEMMKIRGPAAHVLVKMTREGLRLIVCSPTDDNEERLAKRIFELMRGSFRAAGVNIGGAEDLRHEGVKES